MYFQEKNQNGVCIGDVSSEGSCVAWPRWLAGGWWRSGSAREGGSVSLLCGEVGRHSGCRPFSVADGHAGSAGERPDESMNYVGI